MNKPYSQLRNSKLDLTSDSGSHSFRVKSVSRGTGQKQCEAKIEAIAAASDVGHSQYWFEFNGRKISAHVQEIGVKQDFRRVRIDLFVTDPSFWT